MSTLDEDGAAAFRWKPDWLGKTVEDVLDPALPIIDPHQHMWEYGRRYFLDESWEDAQSGHNVIATCNVQCGAMYSADADPLMAPVGETEFANGIAARSATGAFGPFRACAGIIGFADLTQGAAVEPVLSAHKRASPRFRGLRHIAVWDADPAVSTVASFPQGLLLDPKFRQGAAILPHHDLSFETWIYHTQLGELAEFARALPELKVILNHIGTPLGIGIYAGRGDEVFAHWRDGIRVLARCENASVKLSGMAMHAMGFALEARTVPAGSAELAALWKPYVETCIEAFGVERCMFASNFPVEKLACSYSVLWNAFKRLTEGCSPSERDRLFAGTAREVYRLELPA